MPPRDRLPRWGGQAATDLTRAVLRRDFDADLGYAPCHWCGKRADTADHWPIGRDEGGPDTMDNLVSCCRPCNCSRGAIYALAKRRRAAGPSRRW